MARIPRNVLEAWSDREGPVVLTTVDRDGVPNAIYATCVSTYDEDSLLVANNYFAKTMGNISAGSRASLLFLTKGGKSYQFKGTVEYQTQGAVFEHMKTWNPPEHPGHGVVRVRAEEIYSGAERIL